MMSGGRRTFFNFAALTILLLGQQSFAQNYFFHMLGIASSQSFVWTGLAADNDWNNPFNWSTNAVPGVGDVASFKGAACSGVNCNANITTNISVLGVDIDVAYAGTISQGTGHTITIGASGWVQAGGTFAGGDSNMTFTASVLNLTGSSSFTATTAQTYFNETQGVSANVISTTAAVTLTFPNLSTQKFYLQGACGSPAYMINTANAVSFYHLTVATAGTGCGYATFGHNSLPIGIRGDFTNATVISNDAMNFLGNYELYGNMVLGGGDSSHMSRWRWLGSSNSTYSTVGTVGVGTLQIEKSGGATVTPFAGTTQLEVGGLYVKSGSFTLPTALSIYKVNSGYEVFKVDTGTTVTVPTGSTVSMYLTGDCGGPVYTMDVDSNFNFENVVLTGGGAGCGRATLSVAVGDTVTVKKNLTLGSDHNTSGAWILEGNLIKGSMAVGGDLSLTLQGTAAQSLDTLGWGTGPIAVNKTSGTASLSANFSLSASGTAVNVQSGILNLNAKNLTITNNLTVASGAKVLCSGGTLSAGTYTISGEVSCGTGVGITWTGASGDGLWTTAGNWTNNNIPGASDTAIFTSSCTGANCNSNVNALPASVKGIWLTSTYAGTLTQNTNRNITVGTNGWTQTGGTFVGSDTSIVMNGPFSLTGGTFTSTNNILFAWSTVTMSGGTTVFNHNSGTFNLGVKNSVTLAATINGFVFNHFNIYSTNGYTGHRTLTGTVNVDGNFSCDMTNNMGWADGGDIYVKGNITYANLGCRGNMMVHAVGTGNQTITGASGAGATGLEINSTGGTVSLVGDIYLYSDFIYTQGTVAPGTSTIEVHTDSNQSLVVSLASPLTLNHFSVRGYGYFGTRTFTGSDLTVSGNFICDTTYPLKVATGTVHVKGNASFLNEGCYGTTTVAIEGTTNQTVTGVTTADLPSLSINSTGGTVSLSGELHVSTNLAYLQGTVSAGTSTVVLPFDGSTTSTVALSAPLQLYNLTFTGYGSGSIRTLSGSPLTVTGLLSLATSSGATGTLNGGTILAKGDASNNSIGVIGSTIIEVAGSANQTLTGTAAGRWPVVKINSTGGTVSLSGTLEFINDFTYTQGTVDPGTSTVNFVNKPGGSATINLVAPLTLNNVAMTGSNPGGSTHTITGNDLTVNGSFTCDAGNNSAIVNGQTILIKGDVTFGILGCTGTTAVKLTGTTSSTMTVNSYFSGRILGSPITVDKTGGASVTMAGDALLAAGQNLTVANGTLDLNGNAINVVATLTVASGATFKCNGGALTLGTLVNNGTVSCPGYTNYPFQWTGAGGNSNWSTATNWQGGAVPGAGDTPSFSDSFCSPNCNVTIDSSISIRGLEIIAPFGGTITQASGSVITIGNRGWKQPAGTFIGSNANITMTGSTGKFSVTGTASFTAPTATLSVLGFGSGANDMIFTVGSSATFNNNGGTVRFSSLAPAGNNPTQTIDVPTLFQFNNLILGQAGSAAATVTLLPAGTRIIVVNGNLTHGNSDFPAASGYLKMNGNWQLKGNLTVGSDAKGGTATLTLNGTGTQTVTQSSGTPLGGVVTVNKASGSVVLASNLALSTASQDLTITAGTLDMAGFNLTVARNISNSGVLRKGTSPTCGVLAYSGTYTGTAAICP